MMSLITLLLDTFGTITGIFLHSLKLWCLACSRKWTAKQNRFFGSGRVIPSANTIQACQQECLRIVNCHGFDFDQTAQECSLIGPWSQQSGPVNLTSKPGNTHYKIETICPRTYTQNVILVLNSGIATQVSYLNSHL